MYYAIYKNKKKNFLARDNVASLKTLLARARTDDVEGRVFDG